MFVDEHLSSESINTITSHDDNIVKLYTKKKHRSYVTRIYDFLKLKNKNCKTEISINKCTGFSITAVSKDKNVVEKQYTDNRETTIVEDMDKCANE